MFEDEDGGRADARLLAREQEEKDWRALMESAFGRRIVRALLADAGIYHSSYRESVQAMAYAEGRRAFGLLILERASREKDLFLLMQKEALADG